MKGTWRRSKRVAVLSLAPSTLRWNGVHRAHDIHKRQTPTQSRRNKHTPTRHNTMRQPRSVSRSTPPTPTQHPFLTRTQAQNTGHTPHAQVVVHHRDRPTQKKTEVRKGDPPVCGTRGAGRTVFQGGGAHVMQSTSEARGVQRASC